MANLVPLLFVAIAVIFLLVLPMRQRNRAAAARSGATAERASLRAPRS